MNHGVSKRENQIMDEMEIRNILDQCLITHIGLVDGDEPYVIPMNYGYVMENGKLTLYLHSAVKGHKLDLIRKNPKVSFHMTCDAVPFEGEKPCQYGMGYKSVRGKGVAQIVENVDEKIEAMSLFMKTQTGKDFTFNEKLVSIVSVIKIESTEFLGKYRPLPALVQMKMGL